MKMIKIRWARYSIFLLMFQALFLPHLVSCSSSSQKTVEEKKAEIFYGTGTSDLMNKDYTSALKNLIQAAELNPNDSKIMNNLGMAYYFKKQIPTSIYYFEKALKLDPKNSDARNNLASIYLEQEQYDKATEEYVKVSKDLVYSQQYRVFYNLGLIKQKQGLPEEALKYFHEAVKNYDEYCPAHFQLGKAAYSAKQYKEALEEFTASSRGVCYKEPAPLFYQGITLLKMNKPAEAKLKFQDLVQQFPNDEFGEKGRQKLSYLKDVEAAKPLPGVKRPKVSKHALLSGDKEPNALIDFTNENNKDNNKEQTATALP